jgi:hypothetical protein
MVIKFLADIPVATGGLEKDVSGMVKDAASDALKPIVNDILAKIMPVIIALGGLLVLYLIFKLVYAITNHLMKKRVKRIDKRVESLEWKVDEILDILKKKSKSAKPEKKEEEEENKPDKKEKDKK